jgi:hypothetical protein
MTGAVTTMPPAVSFGGALLTPPWLPRLRISSVTPDDAAWRLEPYALSLLYFAPVVTGRVGTAVVRGGSLAPCGGRHHGREKIYRTDRQPIKTECHKLNSCKSLQRR